MLYHYTSLATLEKILDSGGLRATHISFLNDSEEFKYCLNLLSRDIPEEFHFYFSDIAKQEIPASPVFVSCLSSKVDDLNQWRGYGGRTVGIALGFDESLLATCAASQPGFKILPCTYALAEQKELLRPIVDELKAHISNEQPLPERYDAGMSERQRAKGRYYHAHAIVNHLILDIAARIKATKFAEEEEVRLVVSGHAGATGYQRRYGIGMGGAAIVPYVLLACTNAIAEVWVGPGPHMEHCVYGVKEMLTSAGLRWPVHASKVPFRSW